MVGGAEENGEFSGRKRAEGRDGGRGRGLVRLVDLTVRQSGQQTMVLGRLKIVVEKSVQRGTARGQRQAEQQKRQQPGQDRLAEGGACRS